MVIDDATRVQQENDLDCLVGKIDACFCKFEDASSAAISPCTACTSRPTRRAAYPRGMTQAAALAARRALPESSDRLRADFGPTQLRRQYKQPDGQQGDGRRLGHLRGQRWDGWDTR